MEACIWINILGLQIDCPLKQVRNSYIPLNALVSNYSFLSALFYPILPYSALFRHLLSIFIIVAVSLLRHIHFSPFGLLLRDLIFFFNHRLFIPRSSCLFITFFFIFSIYFCPSYTSHCIVQLHLSLLYFSLYKKTSCPTN